MPCRYTKKMSFRRAKKIAKKEYPKLGEKRVKKVAGKIYHGTKGLAQMFIIFIMLAGILAVIVVSGQHINFANLIASLIQPAEMVGGCQFIRPQLGRIECEPISHVPARNTYSNVKPIRVFMCGDNENSPQCEYYFKYTKPSWYSPLACMVHYYTSTGDSNDVWLQRDDETRVVSLPVGATLTVDEMCIGGDWIYVYEDSIRYGLNVYDSGGKFRYNTNSCGLDSLSWQEKNDICTSGDFCQSVKKSDILAFDDWVNYLSDWTPVSVDVSRKIVTYNGKTSYCLVNQIYSINQFQTESSCYSYPDKVVANVDCCPDMETANSICGDDFKWHPIVVGECDASRPCPSGYDCIDNQCVRQRECMSSFECTGQGWFTPDYAASTPTVFKWACQDGQCVVIERKAVECVPPNVGCPANMVCDPNTFKCIEQRPDIILECGDGKCQSPYETYENCPADCEKPFGLGHWIALFLIAAFVSALIIGICFFLPIPFIKILYSNLWFLLIGWLILTIVLMLFFSVPLQIFAGQLVRFL